MRSVPPLIAGGGSAAVWVTPTWGVDGVEKPFAPAAPVAKPPPEKPCPAPHMAPTPVLVTGPVPASPVVGMGSPVAGWGEQPTAKAPTKSGDKNSERARNLVIRSSRGPVEQPAC